jgi:hypothetical protein
MNPVEFGFLEMNGKITLNNPGIPASMKYKFWLQQRICEVFLSFLPLYFLLS